MVIESVKEKPDSTEATERTPAAAGPLKIEVSDLAVSYGGEPAISCVTLQLFENEIFSIIGPSNSGKTSFLKALNRMDMFDPSMRVYGDIRINGRDIRKLRNVYALRRSIGVVFPLPVGLPLSVYENVALAPRLAGVKNRAALDEIVELCLQRAALWDEVKDRLDSLGSMLSGGQQQRLTIARALSQNPEILILDEFSIAVDPVTTMRIEDVLKELKDEMTIILVTNLTQQARRLSDRTAFFLSGHCIEVGETEAIFNGDVMDSRTSEYIEGRFG